eukprot:g1466.t1
MLRRGVLSVAAFAQAQRTCAVTAKGAVGTKAWLSTSTGEDDDPTPAKTKLTFASSVYGKDPQAAAALSDEEAAEIEELRMKAQGGAAGAAAAPIHDPRNMYDSSLSQQAEDGKASGGIKRDVSADTPDATRVAFGATAYGKDPQAAAEVAAEVEELRKKAHGTGVAAGAAAAPIHSSKSLFDSDLTQGAGSSEGSDSINRHVETDTPEATRLVFGGSDYGKDQQVLTRSEEQQAEIEALAARAGAGTATAEAAPIHHDRSMFDSDLAQGAGSAEGSDSINRHVETDTPEATRLVFGGSDYGKDQQVLTRSEEQQAEIEALAARAGAGTATAEAAPIHHDRSMFDSDLAQGAGSSEGSDSINRHVETDTPEATRLVFGGSDYGKDQQVLTRSEEQQAEIEALAARAGAGTATAEAAPIHHDRSMFDSDLAEGAGAAPEFKAINRHVETATPALTRLSFFGSTYGDDDPGANEAEHARELAEKQKKGAKLARVGAGVRGSKVHNTKRAMSDDEYSQEGSE